MENLPLYREIYYDLRNKIKDGTYSENNSLPAERVLCKMYRVSRSTIRRTLDELQKEGYIVKAQGNGNFIKPKIFEQKLTKVFQMDEKEFFQYFVLFLLLPFLHN